MGSEMCIRDRVCTQAPPPLEMIGTNQEVACYLPVGSSAGIDARAQNEAAGVTAAGLDLRSDMEVL